MMRNIIKFSFIFCVVLSILSCKDIDKTYKDLLVPGGVKYTQKPANVVSNSGEGKVKLTWDRGIDPSVSKAIVYWDNFTNTQEVDILGDEPQVTTIITGLIEKDYSFTIKTFDNQGNYSVPVEVNSKSYGDIYKSMIAYGNRSIYQAYYAYPNRFEIVWNGAPEGLNTTQVTYQTKQGEKKIIDVEPDDLTLSCIDYAPNTLIFIASTYIPDTTCMDIFYTNKAEFKPGRYEYRFDKSNWEAEVSSSHPGAGGGGGESLLDGKYYLPGNYWHTGVENERPWVTINVKEPIIITTLILSSRKDSGWNSTRVNNLLLQGSSDGVSWENIGGVRTVGDTDSSPQDFPIEIGASTAYSWFKINLNYEGATGWVSLGEVDIRGVRPEE